ASAATSSQSTGAAIQHLLAHTQWRELLPHNPRLIKRVANTWGMLREVDRHLGEASSDNALVRAAIFMVRFPELAASLRTRATEPPSAKSSSPGAPNTIWDRTDVTAVRGPLSWGDLAQCYGHTFI
ncbi:MAG: hypothetical protein ACK5KU_10335, partial [Beutenbergiaceae bacterium]